jgi:hypothetical protein
MVRTDQDFVAGRESAQQRLLAALASQDLFYPSKRVAPPDALAPTTQARISE